MDAVDDELRLLRNFHTWINSAFGDLFDYLQTRLKIEQVYLDGLQQLATKMQGRAPSGLQSVNAAWEAHLSGLDAEVKLRTQSFTNMNDIFTNLAAEERRRLTSSDNLFHSIIDKTTGYQKAHFAAMSAFGKLSSASAEPKRKSGMLRLVSQPKRPKTTEDVEGDFDRCDQALRITIHALNSERLTVSERLQLLVTSEEPLSSGLKSIFSTFAITFRDLQRLYSDQVNGQLKSVEVIEPNRLVAHRQNILDSQIPPSWSRPIAYRNLRFGEDCRYIIFGLPFTSQDYKRGGYPFNPRPVDVAQVLLANARGWGTLVAAAANQVASGASFATSRQSISRPPSVSSHFGGTHGGASSGMRNPLSTIGETGSFIGGGGGGGKHTGSWSVVNPPVLKERLHELERDWDLDFSRSLNLVKNFKDLGLLAPLPLLAHFFNSLPIPFIPLDDHLTHELSLKFTPTTRWDRGNASSLIKVWDLLKSPEEKTILIKLCELLEIQPEEGGAIFAKPLTRRDGLEIMISELIMNWRNFQPPPASPPLPGSDTSSIEAPGSYIRPLSPTYEHSRPSSPSSAATPLSPFSFNALLEAPPFRGQS